LRAFRRLSDLLLALLDNGLTAFNGDDVFAVYVGLRTVKGTVLAVRAVIVPAVNLT
jgi:hypothetical protein